MMRLLRHIGWLHACDDAGTVLDDAWIAVEGARIVALGREPCPIPAERVAESHDLSGCIVVPGLINLHHHFFQTLTRAVPATVRARPLDWLFGMYPLWAELDEEAHRWATLAAGAELLLTGATTSVDHSYLHPGDGDALLAAQAEAAAELGLRLHVVRGSMPTLEGDLARRLRPLLGDRMDRLLDPEDEIVPQLERAARRWHDDADGAMLRIGFGPTGVTYEKPALMRAVADRAAAFGCGLHTHLHPRPDEREKAERLLGTDPISFLDASGWLRPGTWFAHGSQLRPDEIRRLAEAGCGVAHCPRTIVRLGFPLTPIPAFRKAGLAVGVGVDGAASNDSGSMLGDLRLALLLHRVGTAADADTEKDWMRPADALAMATRNAAAILGRDDIGRIEPGKMADIAAFDLTGVAYAGAVTDPLGGLLMAGSDARASFVMCHGSVRVAGGRLVGMDERRVAAGTNAAARRMVAQATARTGLRFADAQ
ncbi:amidohydrolase family protein [Arenibaculum pallidiluteum]|uniref:amidohydrolase family protein n=1 Tax=Arenibaculum pallidiluteum TaxID=2812559 RepID=UPI001A96C401|nr:amidohydrolase family protein [Arenibaculum pallidiluteum]